MMKFTVKGLIALFVTSSALFSTPMRSDAQINMKTLTEIAQTCQKDVFSKSYYQKIEVNNVTTVNNSYLEYCIEVRYHYSLLLSRSPWLNSTREVIVGYPGSVVVAVLASEYDQVDSFLLDCIISQNSSSNICEKTREKIARGEKYRNRNTNGDLYFDSTNFIYLAYVCPSCVVAYNEVAGSREAILDSFIQWFLKLDKPQRREIISLLGDDKQALELRWSLKMESRKAVQEYREVRQRVEQQEQERRRRELLGN